MLVHRVRVKDSALEHQFQIIGTAHPGVEEMLVDTIDHFYLITGGLSRQQVTSKVYSVHLNTKEGNNFQKGDQIYLNTVNLTGWTVTHELAHALDAAHSWQLSQQMKAYTGSRFLCKPLHYARPLWKLFWYRAGSPPPPCGIDQNFNALEDFAETVTAFIFPEEAKKRAEARGYPYEKWGYTHFHDTPRGQFFKGMVEQEKQ